jgi:hypothetical protein
LLAFLGAGFDCASKVNYRFLKISSSISFFLKGEIKKVMDLGVSGL